MAAILTDHFPAAESLIDRLNDPERMKFVWYTFRRMNLEELAEAFERVDPQYRLDNWSDDVPNLLSNWEPDVKWAWLLGQVCAAVFAFAVIEFSDLLEVEYTCDETPFPRRKTPFTRNESKQAVAFLRGKASSIRTSFPIASSLQQSSAAAYERRADRLAELHRRNPYMVTNQTSPERGVVRALACEIRKIFRHKMYEPVALIATVALNGPVEISKKKVENWSKDLPGFLSDAAVSPNA